LGEIADELTILERRKVQFILDKRIFPESSQERLDLLTGEMVKFAGTHPGKEGKMLQYTERLREANCEIWNLESAIRELKLQEWFPEEDGYYQEVGKRAESIRKINEVRVNYKNLLNRLAGDCEEVKINHLSAGK